MARIKSYVQDTNVTDQDRILGTSYEGILNNKPIYKTRNYKVTDLASYFSQNFDFEGVNYNLSEIKDFQINLANSLGDVNQDGSLANISINFANDLVNTVSTVPDLFTELALSNLSAVPQAFADFLFTIADINEAFANQVLDLATSTAYATVDQFNSLSAFTTQLDTNVQGLEADFTNLSSTVDANTGAITANATALTALGVRVTTAEADVVALDSSFTSLEIIVNENTGDISTNATSITTLGTVVNTATTDIATLKTDVTLLESSIDTLSGEVTANASDISLLTTNVDTIAGDVTAVQTDVTTLTTTVNNNTGDIATQATQVSLLANRVDTAEADILNTQTNVTTLSSTVDGNTGNISTNASNISILQTNVSTAQADITGIITDIQQIETSVNNVTGDVEANAIAISGIGTRVTTAEGEIDNVQGNITTLTTNLNTQTGRIDTNVQNISTLSTAVTDPNTGLVALQGQITTVDNARISGDQVLTSRADLIEAKANGNTANITTNANAVADINGNLSASYGVYVNTAGKVAGLKLLANGALQPSQFIAQADIFAVDMPNGTRVLTVDSGGLTLVGDGTFTGTINANAGVFNGVSVGASGLTAGPVTLTNIGLFGPNFSLNSSGLIATNASISGTFDAGLVNITSNVITLGVNSNYTNFGKISFENSLGTEMAYLTAYPNSTLSGVRLIVSQGTLGQQSEMYLSSNPSIGWRIGSGDFGYIGGGGYSGGVYPTGSRINFVTDTISWIGLRSTNGYVKLFENVYMQWGYRVASATNVYQSFNTSFPTACTYVGVTTNRSSKSNDGADYAYSLTRFGFTAVVESPQDFWWIAIGY